MHGLRYAWLTLILTLLRVLPFPCRTGLLILGHPDRHAPVLLTGNYRLTVHRVRRALRDMDAYLLVANSRGINVWCAATGGHLSNHDVVSVLKTSGIAERVDHRRLILPQLAATGVEGLIIEQKTGWQVVWGPVEADDIPAFIGTGMHKSRTLRTVDFPWLRRLEMAVAWAFPISLLALPLWPMWPAAVAPLVFLVWALSAILFLGFPLFKQRLQVRRKRVGLVLFDLGPGGVLLLLWLGVLALLAAGLFLVGDFSWPTLARWALASLVVLLVLGLDLTGSTPTYKSGLHPDRLQRVELDSTRCRGVGVCEQVCPVDVFEIDTNRRLAALTNATHCVQCGACIVQCPCDALYFRSPSGDIVRPETVRRFKLNLLGKRSAGPG